MKLKHKAEKEIKKEIVEIVGRYIDLNQYKLFFFGSRITGKGNDRSDIDLGIKGEKVVPIKAMSNIKEDLENLSTLYTIDIVDFSKVSFDFNKFATKNIEYLN